MHDERAWSSAALAVATSVLLACAVPASPPTSPAGQARDAPEQPASAAVPSPVFSSDPCERDADCAPVATCHADRCGAAARVGTLPPGTVCTMECRPRTVDCGYNHCGCARAPSGEKLCALLPGEGAR